MSHFLELVFLEFGQREVILSKYAKNKQTLTRYGGVRKRVKHSERCQIIKSETPSGILDLTILHHSRCLILFVLPHYCLSIAHLATL
jgi:hypothetical protein